MSGWPSRTARCGPCPPAITNSVAKPFTSNAPGNITPVALNFTSIAGSALSLDSLTFQLYCETNVTLTFVGTLYYVAAAPATLTLSAQLFLSKQPDNATNILPAVYSIPPQRMTLFGLSAITATAVPFTIVVPIVLPPGTYNASVLVQTPSPVSPSPMPTTVYLDGIMYESYVRTHV